MQIHALLDAETFRRLRTTLGPSVTLVRLSASEIERDLRSGRVGAIVVDPGIVRDEVFTAIVSAAAQGGEGMLLYPPLTKLGIERALEATRKLTVEVVFSGTENAPTVLRALLPNLMRQSVPALVLRELADRIAGLKPVMQRVSIGLFGWGSLPESTGDLAKAAGVNRSTVNRWLHAVGLEASWVLLTCARLARSWAALEEADKSIARVAQVGGFPSPGAFTRDFRAVVGLSPRNAIRELDRARFAERLIAAVKR